MPTLDSFTSQQGASLDSFQFQGTASNIDTSTGNKNIAAQVAALSGDSDGVAQAYLSMSSELDLSGTSALMDRVQEQAKNASYEASRQDILSTMADPNMTDDQRRNVMDRYIDNTSKRYSLPNLVSERALMEDSGDETYEAEDVRIDVAGALEELNDSKRAVASILNAEENRSKSSITGAAADLVEYMAPLAEGAQLSRVVSELRSGKTEVLGEAFLMMGSTRSELNDTLRRMPPENRPMVAQALADIINDNANLLIQDENDMSRLNNLRAALDDSYYGTEDEWIDNAAGWLDIASLGMPIGSTIAKFVRAQRAETAAARATKAANSFDGVGDSGDEVVRKFDDLDNPAEQPVPEVDGLRAEEDAAEAKSNAKRAKMEADPVRREEVAQEGRQQARRAVQSEGDELATMEAAYEARGETRRTGGNAANMGYDELRAAEDEYFSKRRVRSTVSPISLSQNYKDVNPNKARAANEVAGSSEEASEALYGTNRTEAIAHDELPEIARTDGSVDNKVAMPSRAPKGPGPANPRIMNFIDDNGMIYLTDAEKVRTATRVVNDFNNAVGLVTRKEMTTPVSSDIGAGFDVAVTYGPKDAGWRNGQEALDLITHSLRDYAVDENSITLLRRQGDEYRPVDKASANEPGDYLAQIKYPYRISAKDVDDWDDLDVVNNFLDRRPHLETQGGSLQRHLVDAHSMLSPTLTRGATASVARGAALEKTLLEQVKEFGDGFRKLPKGRQSVINDIIKEQNLHSRNLTAAELKGRGVSDAERQVLKEWRDTWDNMYWLENQDMVTSLRNRGYQVMEDSTTDSRLFGKSVGRTQVGKETKVYDLGEGKFVNMTDEMLDDLYEEGGSLFDLRSPMQEGDDAISRVIARNKPGNGAIRGLRDNDQILNYREGYYSVSYTAPKFVDKVVRDSRGTELYRRAVATAGDTKEANLYADRMRASDNGEYVVRNNTRNMNYGDDDNWALQVSTGRTAQRIRGQRLEDANSPVVNAASNHIRGPVDSAIIAARSVSGRVSMRDFLESSKARAINQYGDMFPKNAYGQPMFPGHSSRIVATGNEGSKRAADARTTVEYLNYLENGYINSMDEMLKGGLSALADVLGVRGMSRSERLVRRGSEAANPTAIGKNLSFTLYLALNPLRQFIVQSHQAVQLAAIMPRYAATRMAGDTSLLTTKILNKGGDLPDYLLKGVGRDKAWVDEAYEAMQSSGILAQVDKQNLVRGSVTQLAEDSRVGGAKNPLSTGVSVVRKAGFDTGERINQMTSFLAFFERAKQAKGGGKLSKAEVDGVTADAINYTYNMNRAGDMPYNENALGLMFQFMQVPHKALLQMTSNRVLTGSERARIAAFNGLMYGAPTSGLVYAATSDILPDDGELRTLITQGFESYILNKLLTLGSGEKTDIDFQSSLLPGDATSLYEFATDLMTTDIGEIVASTPAGGLFLGSSPRITNFIRSSAEMFNFVEPVDPAAETTDEFLRATAELASGTSSALKMMILKNAHRKVSKSGDVVDSEVSSPEVWAQLFGFGTLDTREYWEVTMANYKASEDYEKDLRKWYTNLKTTLTREGITTEETAWWRRVNNAVAEVYQGDPEALSFMRQQMKYDVQNNNFELQESVMRNAGIDPAGTRDMIRRMPNVTDEQRQALLDRLDSIDKAHGDAQ